MKRLLLAGVAAAGLLLSSASAWSADKLLNASYDVARELFVQINQAFAAAHPGVTVDQSHAGTSKQARSIVEGLEADVVTFNQVPDVDFLVKNGFVSDDWQKDFPNRASPFYSLPSFLVRAGTPKNIKDWNDLVRDDVQVIFPNPKTSGNARYTYLAATAYAKEAFNGDEAKVRGFVTKLFDNVPVFDTGGRGSTTTFAERELGDVLITFESETQGIAREYGTDKYEQPNSRSPSSTRSSTHMAAAISPRPTSTSSIRRKARRSRQRTACASATRRSPRSSRTSSPTCGW